MLAREGIIMYKAQIITDCNLMSTEIDKNFLSTNICLVDQLLIKSLSTEVSAPCCNMEYKIQVLVESEMRELKWITKALGFLIQNRTPGRRCRLRLSADTRRRRRRAIATLRKTEVGNPLKMTKRTRVVAPEQGSCPHS